MRLRGEASSKLSPSLPLQPLLILSFGFAFDTECGNRSGHQPFFRDGPSTGLADSKGPIINPIQCLFDFRDQLSLTVLNPQKEISVRFQRGPVCGVGEVSIAVLTHIRTCLSSFHEQLMKHSLEQSFKIENLFLIHSDSPWGDSDSSKRGDV
jgi:hypothetical protein